MHYRRDKNEKWIYCNYPELLVWKAGTPPLGFAESGHCLNRQTVSGVAEIFFSYMAEDSEPYNFAIYVHNGNEQPITLLKLGEGFHNGWNAALRHMRQC